MTSETRLFPLLPSPGCTKLWFLSFKTAHLRSTRSFWCVFTSQINDAFFLTFWNYATFLSVLFMYFEIGVFKWRGRAGVGGTYHFTHFHIFTQRLCISVVLSTQKGTRRQTVTCRGTDHLVLSLFLQQYDGTKVHPWWCGWGTAPVWNRI